MEQRGIVKILKKGTHFECGNQTGICTFPAAWEISVKLILAYVKEYLEGLVGKE